MVQQYSSALLEKAVGEFSKLPGIGRKTALRLVLFMLRQGDSDVDQFVNAVSKMKREVKYCRVCHNVSDTDVCPICSDSRRDASTICVVENVQDVLRSLAMPSSYHQKLVIITYAGSSSRQQQADIWRSGDLLRAAQPPGQKALHLQDDCLLQQAAGGAGGDQPVACEDPAVSGAELKHEFLF